VPDTRDTLLACRGLDAPLGLPPLGPATSALARISPCLLSHAFQHRTHSPGWRRRRVSIGVRSAPPSARQTARFGWSNPSGVFAPACILSIQTSTHPGYVFTFRRVAHYCRPIGELWMVCRSTRVVRIG